MYRARGFLRSLLPNETGMERLGTPPQKRLRAGRPEGKSHVGQAKGATRAPEVIVWQFLIPRFLASGPIAESTACLNLPARGACPPGSKQGTFNGRRVKTLLEGGLGKRD